MAHIDKAGAAPIDDSRHVEEWVDGNSAAELMTRFRLAGKD
jgi:hypothetical protein